MKKFSQYLLVVGFIAVLFYITPHKNIAPVLPLQDIRSVTLAGQNIQLELALTSEAQERGLSGRKFLLPNTGMLFIFPTSGVYFFWMKDMNFPIDIIWIDEEGKVVDIAPNASPTSYPNTFGGSVKAKYVLEVGSRFTEQYGLKIGDRVTFH